MNARSINSEVFFSLVTPPLHYIDWPNIYKLFKEEFHTTALNKKV